MNIRIASLTVTLLFLALPALPQAPAPQAKQEDPAAKEKEESRKRLAEIDKVQDTAKRRELLEKYIQENPKASNLDSAYSSLLSTLYGVDPARAVSLADEILARPRDPKAFLWKNAYMYKFLALQKQISDLGGKILETELDSWVLQRAADFDKEHSQKLFEKAIAEREKDSKKDSYPTVEELRFAYARKLSELGKKDKAVKEASRAIDLDLARVADVEALPKEDPKRRGLEEMRQRLAPNYRELASLLADTGEPQKALETLARADELIGSSGRAREMRPSIEETRARIYANMGKTEEALESYARSFAFRMSDATRDKIRELAARSGRRAEDYFTRARQLRLASVEPFEPFELKTDEGKQASLDSLKGKVTLVNFFFPT